MCPSSEGARHEMACDDRERRRIAAQGTRLCLEGCGRPHAQGFSSCCQSCVLSNGRQHGPRCEAAWKAAQPGSVGAVGAAATFGAAFPNVRDFSSRPCSNNCGRFAYQNFRSCCKECELLLPVGTQHSRFCESHHKVSQQSAPQLGAQLGAQPGHMQRAPQLGAQPGAQHGAIQVIPLAQFIEWRNFNQGSIAHIKGFGNGMSNCYNEDAIQQLQEYAIIAWDGDPPTGDGFTALVPKFLMLARDKKALAFKIEDGVQKLRDKWSPYLGNCGTASLTIVSVSLRDFWRVKHEQHLVASLPTDAQNFYFLGRLAIGATQARQVISLGGGGIAGLEAEASLRENVRWTVYALSRGRKEEHPSLMDWAGRTKSPLLTFVCDGRDPTYANAFAQGAPVPASSQPAATPPFLDVHAHPQAQAAPQLASYSIWLQPDIGPSSCLTSVDMRLKQSGQFGLHAAVCGWAGKASSPGHYGQVHRRDLTKALLEEMKSAAQSTFKSGPCQLYWDNPLEECDGDSLKLDLGPEQWLNALTRIAIESRLYGVAPMSLRISLGSRGQVSAAEVEQVRKDLRQCRSWRLAVVESDSAKRVAESQSVALS